MKSLILFLSFLLSFYSFAEVLPDGGWWPCHKGLHFECKSQEACHNPKKETKECLSCSDPECGCTIQYEFVHKDFRERKCFRKGQDIFLDKFAENTNNWLYVCETKMNPECLNVTNCNSPTNLRYKGCENCLSKYCGCTFDFVIGTNKNGKKEIEKRLCYRSGKDIVMGIYTREP